jgi:hypothetical protein
MAVPNIFATKTGPIPLNELDTNFAAVPTSIDLAASTGSTLVSTIQSDTGAVARTVASKLNDTVSVKDFGAVGDGVADDTAAIQTAVNFGILTNSIVFFPSGNYKITNKINLNGAVRITGTNFIHYSATSPKNGSRILIVFTTATARSAFDVTAQGVVIEWLQFYTDSNPTPGSGWSPSANQPWAIYVYRAAYGVIGGDGCQIRHVGLDGIAYGIKTDGAWAHIDDVRGVCFNTFIEIDGAYDVTRLTNIMSNSYWWNIDANVASYIQANCTFIRLGRVDNPQLSNIFVFGVNIGIEIFNSTAVTPAGSTSLLEVNNFGFDACNTGIKWTETSSNQKTAMITNGYFNCLSLGIHVTSIAYVNIDLVNIQFPYSGNEAIKIDNGFCAIRMASTNIVKYNALQLNKTAFNISLGSMLYLSNTVTIAGGSGANTATALQGSTHTQEGTIQSPLGQNLILNGGFDNWSRGTSFPNILNTQRCADNWRVFGTNPTPITVARSTDVPSNTQFTYSMSVTVTTGLPTLGAGDYIKLGSLLEGTDIQKVHLGKPNSQSLVLTFWVKSSVTGIYSMQLANGAYAMGFYSEFNVLTANTWQLVSVVIPPVYSGTFSNSNAAGLYAYIILAAGATAKSSSVNVWALLGSTQGSTNAINFLATTANTLLVTGFGLTQGETPNSFQDTNNLPLSRYVQALPVYVPVTASPALITFPPMRAAPTISAGGTGFSATNITTSSAVISQTTAAAQTLVLTSEL